MVAISNPDTVARWVGRDATDPLFLDAWRAADEFLSKMPIRLPADMPEGEGPAPLQQAVALETARLLQRRNSPDGTIGLGDLGAVTVPYSDPDVKALIAPYRTVVFG